MKKLGIAALALGSLLMPQIAEAQSYFRFSYRSGPQPYIIQQPVPRGPGYCIDPSMIPPTYYQYRDLRNRRAQQSAQIPFTAGTPLTEERAREIIREELAKAPYVPEDSGIHTDPGRQYTPEQLAEAQRFLDDTKRRLREKRRPREDSRYESTPYTEEPDTARVGGVPWPDSTTMYKKENEDLRDENARLERRLEKLENELRRKPEAKRDTTYEMPEVNLRTHQYPTDSVFVYEPIIKHPIRTEDDAELLSRDFLGSLFRFMGSVYSNWIVESNAPIGKKIRERWEVIPDITVSDENSDPVFAVEFSGPVSNNIQDEDISLQYARDHGFIRPYHAHKEAIFPEELIEFYKDRLYEVQFPLPEIEIKYE